MYKWKTLLITLLLLAISWGLRSQDIVNLRQTATRYHNKFENRKTSSGERFSQKKYTAAHKSIKLGTYLLVVDAFTNKWVVVKVNDRCPRKNIIDLAGIAADRIGLTLRKGVAKVFITALPNDAEQVWQRQESLSEFLNDSIRATILNVPSNTIINQPVVDSKTTVKPKNTEVKRVEGSPQSKTDNLYPAKIIIYYIENTKIAEEIVAEFQPSIAFNAKIMNDTDSIRIEIEMEEGADKFVTDFKKKYPRYIVTEIYNSKN